MDIVLEALGFVAAASSVALRSIVQEQMPDDMDHWGTAETKALSMLGRSLCLAWLARAMDISTYELLSLQALRLHKALAGTSCSNAVQPYVLFVSQLVALVAQRDPMSHIVAGRISEVEADRLAILQSVDPWGTVPAVLVELDDRTGLQLSESKSWFAKVILSPVAQLVDSALAVTWTRAGPVFAQAGIACSFHPHPTKVYSCSHLSAFVNTGFMPSWAVPSGTV